MNLWVYINIRITNFYTSPTGTGRRTRPYFHVFLFELRKVCLALGIPMRRGQRKTERESFLQGNSHSCQSNQSRGPAGCLLGNFSHPSKPWFSPYTMGKEDEEDGDKNDHH